MQHSSAVIRAVQAALSSLEAGHDPVLGVNPAPDNKWLRKHAHRVAEGAKILIERQAAGFFEHDGMKGVNLAIIESEGPLALAFGKSHQEAAEQLGLSTRELKLMGFAYTAPKEGVGGHDREFTQAWGEQLLAALWVYAAQQAHATLAAIE